MSRFNILIETNLFAVFNPNDGNELRKELCLYL